MKLLQNKVNVTPPDATYPFGKSQDDTGTNNGTPLNFERFNDWDQLFEKMFDRYSTQYGVAANDLPDNAVNGFQLFDAFLNLSRPYKVFTVILSQTGTNPPTANVLQNEFPAGDITFGRNGAGIYTIDSASGVFTVNKTFVINEQGSNSNNFIGQSPAGANQIQVYTYFSGALQDGVMINDCFEIRVYD